MKKLIDDKPSIMPEFLYEICFTNADINWRQFMNIILLGADGFIGTNLVLELAKDNENFITVVDRKKTYFKILDDHIYSNLKFIQLNLTANTNYEKLVRGQDIVYHLISTITTTTSNQAIEEELNENIMLSAKLFDACVHQNVKKVVFLSSGGAVYGKENNCPLNENAPTNPITTYGIQKLTIEKLLYLYNYLFGLDYRIIRLSNPYGPFQRPNNALGAVSNFIYKALKGEEIEVYGDGSVVRDFIYIDDAIRGILNIVYGNVQYRLFNLGCGYGTSINQILDTIIDTLDINICVKNTDSRKVDVPINYLDINRYESAYGKLNPICLQDGIKKTASFIKTFYQL